VSAATNYVAFILTALTALLLPPLLLATIRKTKARMQNRLGTRLFQPYYDLLKFLAKAETVSSTTSWVFRSTAVANLVTVILIAFLTPWLSYGPHFRDASDLFLIVYLFGLARFMTVLAALDAGSVFGGFGASREVTLALLIEPGVVLALASLACVAHTSSLGSIMSYSLVDNPVLYTQPIMWLLAGSGLFLASVAELSRMPVDDPTTHLELTMVHEAMILENSGRNLALTEYTHVLKMAVLLGLSGQCFLHSVADLWSANDLVRGAASIAIIFALTLVIALMESLIVKLQWRKVPEFISYAVGMSLLCFLIAVGVR